MISAFALQLTLWLIIAAALGLILACCIADEVPRILFALHLWGCRRRERKGRRRCARRGYHGPSYGLAAGRRFCIDCHTELPPRALAGRS